MSASWSILKLTRQSPNLTRYPFGTPARDLRLECCPVGGGEPAISWHFSLIATARFGCMRVKFFKASRVQVSLGMPHVGISGQKYKHFVG
jgi:hypothetical protein